jgi:hypothetical protein
MKIITTMVPLPTNAERLEVSAPRTSNEDQGVLKIDHRRRAEQHGYDDAGFEQS